MKTLFFSVAGLALLTVFTTGIWSAEPAAHSGEEPDQPASADTRVDYEDHSIEEVLANPTDQELVKISGEIIRKIKCSTYLFRGESGDIHIKIDTHAVPEQGIPFREATVIKGTVKHSEDKKPTIEADHIHYVF
ncbi:NirD/YgiW/YdeI family stress tolerance protein [Endozoicomonas lisbonensis]|uniref:Uncharacterized protein YdeI (BOF family) n=1 Tax=Endozoicomonas lisbonensis TaxID=3120522 RepID=A0ABV2SIX3_9GAMM